MIHSIGLGLAMSLALVAMGETLWILARYVDRLRDRADRRSGLLPRHVAHVAAWANVALARMVIRDLYDDPPLWTEWPLTIALAAWLIYALSLIVRLYISSPRPPHPREVDGAAAPS